MPIYFEGYNERRRLPFTDFRSAEDHHTLVLEATGVKFTTTLRLDDGPSKTYHIEGGGEFTLRQAQ